MAWLPQTAGDDETVDRAAVALQMIDPSLSRELREVANNIRSDEQIAIEEGEQEVAD